MARERTGLTMPFKFALGARVLNAPHARPGVVEGRAEFSPPEEPRYFIRYEPDHVGLWWRESVLTAAGA